MTRPVFKGVNLVARDLDATLAFYRALGMEIPDEVVWGSASGPHHVEVPNGGGADFDLDSEALARAYNAGFEGGGAGRCLLGFAVATRDEVDARHAALVEAGHRSLQPPYDAFWGARYAIVEDPDGHAVGIGSPPDDAHRGTPPAV